MMKRRPLARLLLCALLICGVTDAARADIDKGFAAYDANDYATALRELRGPALAGDVPAQMVMGQLYFMGTGVNKNLTEALKWYRLAANKGYAQAQFVLGGMAEEGLGMQRNDQEARRWYRLAAEQNNLDAQVRYGRMLIYGTGGPKDLKEGANRVCYAADKGDEIGQFDCGVCYFRGLGVLMNYKIAMKWYRLSAERQYVHAITNLGGMYEKGEGVAKPNHVVAYALFNLASALDSSDNLARNDRDIVAKELTAIEINAAQALSQEMLTTGKVIGPLDKFTGASDWDE